MYLYPLPEEPYNEVIPGLCQADGILDPAELFVDGFDVVVDMTSRNRPLGKMTGTLYVRLPIHDVDEIGDPEVIRSIARLVADEVRRGRRVAVNCTAGLNRSGLVVARALLELGFDGEEAIELVRRARGPWALCNEGFEAWILDETRVGERCLV